MGAPRPLIFDIKRHALEDGPGIRTTVFFKGCNLRCLWCHNPESLNNHAEIGFYPRDCIQCGDCVAACKVSACDLDNSGRIDRQRCNRCGDCAAVCPSQALRLIGRFYPVEELLEVVLRDRSYYQVSGGGVTISGGEPTLAMDYCRELLGQLKERGVHTAIQTNGYFSWPRFRDRLLPHLDLIMFDVKLARSRPHREYTGQSHAPIWANLRRLLKARPEIVLPRIPLVPGFTATPENLRALSRLLQQLGVRKCVLLPYNPTWFHKAESLGQRVDPRLSPHLPAPLELAACREIFSWAELAS